jgi:hypothetical protein
MVHGLGRLAQILELQALKVLRVHQVFKVQQVFKVLLDLVLQVPQVQ